MLRDLLIEPVEILKKKEKKIDGGENRMNTNNVYGPLYGETNFWQTSACKAQFLPTRKYASERPKNRAHISYA